MPSDETNYLGMLKQFLRPNLWTNAKLYDVNNLPRQPEFTLPDECGHGERFPHDFYKKSDTES